MSGWIPQGYRGEIIEVIIRDSTGAKINSFKSDINNFYKLLNLLSKKYGVKIKPNKEKDLDWIK